MSLEDFSLDELRLLYRTLELGRKQAKHLDILDDPKYKNIDALIEKITPSVEARIQGKIEALEDTLSIIHANLGYAHARMEMENVIYLENRATQIKKDIEDLKYEL